MAARPERDGRILVVVQLDGGNDGINTVVPFGDEDYARHRRELRIPTDRVCKLTDRVGLHPAMRSAADMIQDGRLAIVQGVGYPNPDRSHFRSMAIWQTARPDDPEPEFHGWLGRALDGIGAGMPASASLGPSAVFIGERDLPRALRGRRTVTASFADPADLALAVPAAAVASPDQSAGDDLAAFVHRTVTNAYTTAEQLADSAATNERHRRPLPGLRAGPASGAGRSIHQGGRVGAGLLHDPIRLRYARIAVADPGAVAR